MSFYWTKKFFFVFAEMLKKPKVTVTRVTPTSLGFKWKELNVVADSWRIRVTPKTKKKDFKVVVGWLVGFSFFLTLVFETKERCAIEHLVSTLQALVTTLK